MNKKRLKKDVKGKWTTNQYDWFKDDNIFWKNFKEYTKDAKKLIHCWWRTINYRRTY